MPIKVEVLSLIRTISADDEMSKHTGEAAKVLEEIRGECDERGQSLSEWAAEIRKHGPITPNHPFSELCRRLNLPDDHPLRTLGSWAFGMGNPWIIINWIQVDNQPIIPRKEFDPTAR